MAQRRNGNKLKVHKVCKLCKVIKPLRPIGLHLTPDAYRHIN